MTELHLDNGDVVLFSYETPVSARVNCEYVRTDKFYSITTSRHINQWLDGIEATLKSQDYFNQIVKAE